MPGTAPSDSKTGSCPHLGIQEDPQTCLGYPAEWNLCYRAKPVSAVSLEQQRVLCLSPVYMRCPVFLSERGAPLPKELRGARAANKLKWALLVALLLLIVLGLWATWRTQSGRAFPPLGAIPLPLATGPASLKISAPAPSATPLALAAFTRAAFPVTCSYFLPSPLWAGLVIVTPPLAHEQVPGPGAGASLKPA